MLLAVFTVLCFIAGTAGHNSVHVPSFIPQRAVEPTWKAPKEYLELRHHDIISRDHGCVDLPEEVEGTYKCVNIWLKNKYSTSQVKPTSVFLEYQYAEEEIEHSFKPVVTWVENINPWRVRGCVAHPGGHKSELGKGKLRWLAVYNTPQSSNEQHGIINVNTPITSAKHCFPVVFPQAFSGMPTMKFQIKLKYGLMTAQDAMVVWGKGIGSTQATVCLEEFYAWSRYHHEFEIHWYGISAAHTQDAYSTHNKVVFPANEAFPSDHRMLNHFYCKNVTLPNWYYPCPAILVQAVEQNTAVCENTLVAWVAFHNEKMMTVCYADKRGIMGIRKVDVEVHYIAYGIPDKCETHICNANQECIHPTWNTVACGCYKECKEGGDKACGTNMMTYKNRCELEKAACESGFKFEYAHHGECEDHTHDHGRHQLVAVAGCEGLYCAQISTGSNIWYKDAKINVQVSVNWMNSISGSMPSTHDATASWVENVTPNGFKACVMEAGRKTLASGPYINWFAYQGEIEKIMTHKIEIGEWRSGTHCVPIHERKTLEKPMPYQVPTCPNTDINDAGKVDEATEKFHYDSNLMSMIHGKHQHEWFKRMMKGYGIQKLNLTSGMQLKGATLMLTVEHEHAQSTVTNDPRDAVNAWIEYDGATQEAYVCLREMQNWDGQHKGIHVHWTLFMDEETKKEDVWMTKKEGEEEVKKPVESTDDKKAMELQSKIQHTMMSNKLGFIHKVHFKPTMMAPEYNNYAFCQTKKYLPENFTMINSATVLVSVDHHIPAHAAFESMKKYQLHQTEVMKGMPLGDMMFNKEKEQTSWMMPHMWRANLTGWRPHMRISKNSDYSAWIEGMNNSHIRVCQKSVFSGYHYEGVHVNMMIMPDHCPTGYTHHEKEGCVRYQSSCGSFDNAAQACQNTQDKLVAPIDGQRNVFLSYVAGQKSVWVAKTDRNTEGTWVSSNAVDGKSYFRWAAGEPKSSPSTLDCAVQGGRSLDFTESAKLCDQCYPYACGRMAAQQSCDFPHKYCHHDGKCEKSTSGFTCKCMPPYTGPRCETKM